MILVEHDRKQWILLLLCHYHDYSQSFKEKIVCHLFFRILIFLLKAKWINLNSVVNCLYFLLSLTSTDRSEVIRAIDKIQYPKMVVMTSLSEAQSAISLSTMLEFNLICTVGSQCFNQDHMIHHLGLSATDTYLLCSWDSEWLFQKTVKQKQEALQSQDRGVLVKNDWTVTLFSWYLITLS